MFLQKICVFLLLYFCTTQTQEVEDKIAALKQAIAANPAALTSYEPLIEALKQRNRYHEAIGYARLLCEKQPTLGNQFNLGCLLLGTGDTQEAITIFNNFLSHSYQSSVLYNIGYAHKMAGNLDASLDYYFKALALKPDNENTKFAISRAYLQKGDFSKGWEWSEEYLKKSGKFAPEVRALIHQDTLNGKTIVLLPEGGLGDTLQFIRYGREFKQRGANVIAVAQKSLVQLLSLCPYLDSVIPVGSARPACDGVITMMSAPAAFNSDGTTIPHAMPYLYANAKLTKYWHQRMHEHKEFRIGICWQADVYNDSSRLPVAHRGMPLALFTQLADIPNIHFYSLQKYDGIEQLQDLPQDFPITIFDENFDKENGSFMDTAAIMMHLDLIITVDTAIAHLAGGLGKPVWLLLPYSTDWRWITGRNDSPWYPTMKIFKQSKPFDWAAVMQEVKSALRNRTA